MKNCPFCAEEIQDAAIVCKHCDRELSSEQNSAVPASPPASTESPSPDSSEPVPWTRSLGLAGEAELFGVNRRRIGFALH
jgi:hypothetical protein